MTNHRHISRPAPLLTDADPGEGAVLACIDALRHELNETASLDAALAVVSRVAGADRVALLVCEPHAEVMVSAQGPRGDLPRPEWEEISRTVVSDARRRGRAVIWDAFDAAEGQSLAELGVLAALALPLADDAGVLYADVRTPGKCVADAHLPFFRTAAALVGDRLAHQPRLAQTTARSAEREERSLEAPRPLFDLLASPTLDRAAAAVRSALSTDLNVLILGESGTGKTELAMALARALGDGPVVRATLGTTDDLNTLTSELFGHERGAYSGAAGRRIGLVERADGGTLFFDEVLNLAPAAQQLLLDFTQFGQYRPLGYDAAEPRRARARIISATQGDLAEAVAQGSFRRDLYYRLAGVEIHLPPLRERREDIPSLATSLLRQSDPGRPWQLSLDLRRALTKAGSEWAGNLRELGAVVQRARHRALERDPETTQLERADLDESQGEVADPPAPRASAGATLEAQWSQLNVDREHLRRRERELLERALDEERGVVSRVARRLGVARTTLLHRLSVLGLRDRG